MKLLLLLLLLLLSTATATAATAATAATVTAAATKACNKSDASDGDWVSASVYGVNVPLLQHTVEARKLEHHSPPAFKVKYGGCQH